MNAYEKEILENIERDGFHITAVVDPESSEPPFVYSVGWSQSIEQPEVIIFGLDPYTAGYLLKMIYIEAKDGMRIKEGLEYELDGSSVIFRKVASDRLTKRYFNSAIWHHRQQSKNKKLMAFQIVLPDDRGRFPWDPGCDPEVRSSQPPLYESEAIR